LERSAKADARFGNIDNDPLDDWKQGDLAAQGEDSHPTMVYQIQSPFTGELHPPPSGRHWGAERRRIKTWLEEWGWQYVERDVGDGRRKALVLKGATITNGQPVEDDSVLAQARTAAEQRLAAGGWPRLYFGKSGQAKPMLKLYKGEVKAGSVPVTFWVDEVEEPLVLDSVSWQASESGRSREGVEELDRLVGRGHGFETVKPLQLFRKIVQSGVPRPGSSWTRLPAVERQDTQCLK
jgi:adenine-specific DNA-methyltransferase